MGGQKLSGRKNRCQQSEFKDLAKTCRGREARVFFALWQKVHMIVQRCCFHAFRAGTPRAPRVRPGMGSNALEWTPLALATPWETFALKGRMGHQRMPFESSGSAVGCAALRSVADAPDQRGSPK
jgi:hypothetical protein